MLRQRREPARFRTGGMEPAIAARDLRGGMVLKVLADGTNAGKWRAAALSNDSLPL